MFLFPILLAVVVYFLITGKKTPQQFSSKQDIPLEQLKKRYVMGEIDEEMYMKMKKIITE